MQSKKRLEIPAPMQEVPGNKTKQSVTAMTDVGISPCLSIIIPTYNRPSILLRALVSALAACPDGSEIIVVDDQSNTAEGALHSVADDPRLKIFTNEGDKGAAGARNFGVTRARGKVILFLDDDDELIPDYPERVLAAAEHSKADFGFSAAMLVDHQSHTEHSNAGTTDKTLQQGVLPANVPLQYKMPGLGYGVWIRKATFQDVGGICADLVVDEDGDLFCRLYGIGHRCWFEAAPGVRIHRAYETGGEMAPTLSIATHPVVEARCRLRTYQKNHRYFPLRSADRWFLIRRILRHAAYKGVDDVAKHADFTLLVRDAESLAPAQTKFNCPVSMCPDSAYVFGASKRTREVTLPALCMLRTDSESGLTHEDRMKIATYGPMQDWVNETQSMKTRRDRLIEKMVMKVPLSRTALRPTLGRIYEKWARERMDRGIAQLSTAELVITDRLHVHILCTLLGISHIVFDNNYGKISRHISAWPKSKLANAVHNMDEFRTIMKAECPL